LAHLGRGAELEPADDPLVASVERVDGHHPRGLGRAAAQRVLELGAVDLGLEVAAPLPAEVVALEMPPPAETAAAGEREQLAEPTGVLWRDRQDLHRPLRA